MQSSAKKAALPAITLAALGVVFGDIGTSPLYALKESFHAAHGLGISTANVLGILSIIFWTMTLVITIKYIAIVMRADNNGEGGIMALLALNLRNTRFSDRKKLLLIAIGFIGASLFFGDGIITTCDFSIICRRGSIYRNGCSGSVYCSNRHYHRDNPVHHAKVWYCFCWQIFWSVNPALVFLARLIGYFQYYTDTCGTRNVQPTLGISVYCKPSAHDFFYYGSGSAYCDRW